MSLGRLKPHMTMAAKRARIQAVAEAVREGKPLEHIAATFDIAISYVDKIAREHGLTERMKRTGGRQGARNRLIVESFIAGTSQTVLAKQYGLHQSRIAAIVKAAGVVLTDEERTRRQSHRLPISDDQRAAYNKIAKCLGAAAAREEFGIAA